MINKVNKKLYNWASIIESNTLEQALTTSSMDFVYPHLALMPDAHLGRGSTVGSVVPTKGAIMPACVGVDIGCGMIAVQTNVSINQLQDKDLKALRKSIENKIPLSAGKYNSAVHKDAEESISYLNYIDGGEEAYTYAPNWEIQLGSLGSGNHFIELSTDEDGLVWFFLHSGSRGVGNKIATHWIKVAQELNNDIPHPDLAYLLEGTDEFNEYYKMMTWAQEFAYQNRVLMMDRVIESFDNWFGQDYQFLQRINCHHNFTNLENHYGEDLYITRKGAISANKGEWGLIPGSMGDASYVVKGKGCKESFNSSPHGAGRNHSRSAARKIFTLEDLEKRMEGVEWNHSSAFIDEHPEAYKNIDQVMLDASDLVEIKYKLKQFINIKGD